MEKATAKVIAMRISEEATAAEWLRKVQTAGLLTGEVQQHVQALLSENGRLMDANANLEWRVTRAEQKVEQLTELQTKALMLYHENDGKRRNDTRFWLLLILMAVCMTFTLTASILLCTMPTAVFTLG